MTTVAGTAAPSVRAGAGRQARLARLGQLARRVGLPLALGVALAAAAVLVWFAVKQTMAATRIDAVRVEGAFGRVTREEIERSLSALVAGHSLLDVPMADIAHELGGLSWVEGVDIYRVWPHGLVVRVTEKVPVAHWNDDGYISHAGEVFQPENTVGAGPLPTLRGPADKSVQVMDFYQGVNSMLLPLGMSVRELTLNDQLSWEIVTGNGIRLRVDQADSLFRLRRFLQVYEKQLYEVADRIASVDLRYIGGFAVRWKPAAPVSTTGSTGAVAPGGEDGQIQR